MLERHQAGYGGDHLLSQDIQWLLRDLETVELAHPNGANGRSRLKQLVAGQWIENPLGNRSEPVARSPHPLEQAFQRPRCPQMTHQVHMTDVDAEFE